VYYRASLPLDPADTAGSHQGLWYAVLSLRKVGVPDRAAFVAASQGLSYDLIVHCYSNLVFHANAQQTSFEPGAVVDLFATLSEYDVPVDHRATVWCELQRPDGSSGILTLSESDPGRFTSASLPALLRTRPVFISFAAVHAERRSPAHRLIASKR
jgi:hypothetical protein